MNIMLLTYEGGMAGSTNSISYLAKGLSNRGHHVFVVCKENTLLAELLKNTKVNIIYLPLKGRLDWFSIKSIAQLTRKEGIQILNAQSSYDRYLVIFAKLFFRLKAKVIHTRRQEPASVGGFQTYFYQWFTDKIVVISDELKKSFIKIGFSPSHLHVIYNGIPKERFLQFDELEVKRLKEQHGFGETDIVIGCISRKKKQDQLIKALPLLNENYKILLAGVDLNEYQDLTQSLGVKQEIIYAGKIDPSQILNYYRLLTVNTLCSTTDGFGLTLVESMAMKVPVVATRAGGIINVISDGEDGLLFGDNQIEELANKIKEAAENKVLRQTLIEGGKKKAFETFSMENTITNYEYLFTELIK